MIVHPVSVHHEISRHWEWIRRGISEVMRVLVLRLVVDWVLPAQSTMLNKSSPLLFRAIDSAWSRRQQGGKNDLFHDDLRNQYDRIMTSRCDLENWVENRCIKNSWHKSPLLMIKLANRGLIAQIHCAAYNDSLRLIELFRELQAI